jgi:hypothetical protein
LALDSRLFFINNPSKDVVLGGYSDYLFIKFESWYDMRYKELKDKELK